MSTWRRLFRRRPYALALAGGLFALLAGDRAQLAPPPGVGIDPFEILDQQVRNNVLIVLDTSGSMKWPSDRDDFTLGGDDPASRMAQAKAAIKSVVQANQNRVNFGLVSYNALSTDKTINRNQDFEGDGRIDGPFIYVSADANAALFYSAFSNTDDGTTGENEACTNVDGFFCRPSNTFAAYDGANSGDVWRSFMNRNGTNQTLAYNDPYPAGCTVGGGVLSPVDLSVPAAMRCRYYMQSRLIRNGVRFTWNRASTNLTTRLTATAAITCPAPPAGLLGHTFTAPC
ncbi:MAG TPA: VWA domain-containing protein, partial [Vicinamibacteria bacterium]|nr:VWA domain-containing protein [Vicinamibacteria bacterium]